MTARHASTVHAAVETAFFEQIGRLFGVLCASLARGETLDEAAERFEKGVRQAAEARDRVLGENQVG